MSGYMIEEVLALGAEKAKRLVEVEAERDAALARVEVLERALKFRDVERRQWALAELLIAKGYFNRRDLCETFGISVPQASIDIRTWLSRNQGAAVYNTTTKRYERAALPPSCGNESMGEK